MGVLWRKGKRRAVFGWVDGTNRCRRNHHRRRCFGPLERLDSGERKSDSWALLLEWGRAHNAHSLLGDRRACCFGPVLSPDDSALPPPFFPESVSTDEAERHGGRSEFVSQSAAVDRKRTFGYCAIVC